MESTPQRHRRLEGSPLKWKELTDKQKSAVELTAKLMLDALNSLDERSKTKSEYLDYDRRSQMAFIDGDRGMGKSCVLLTIQAILQNEKVDDITDGVAKDLLDKRNRFVWLETLDMEPLPRNANILAAILARIEAKIDGLGGDAKPPPRMCLAFDELSSSEETRTEFCNLKSTAVRAWTGIEPQRAAKLDPDSYVEEVLASETAGLKLNSRLSELLDKIAKLKRTTSQCNGPIFILPVDDFDMAPTRCLELLRVLRMITTPRLFFLVAGNCRIAEDALRLQCEGELAALAGAQMASHEAAAIRERSIEIAANNLRKLIPPQQRARLEEMTIEEALKSGENGKTLGEVLEGISFHRNIEQEGAGPISLKEFFLRHDSDFKIDYSGAAWLGGTPRQVRDRIAAFSRQDKQGNRDKQPDEWNEWNKRLLRTISEELAREIRESCSLTHDQRMRLLSVVEIVNDISFDFTRGLRLTFIMSEPLKNVKFDDDNLLQIWFTDSVHWLFLEPEKQENNQEQIIMQKANLVPQRISAGLTFLHDLAISLWGRYVPGHFMPTNIFINYPVVKFSYSSKADSLAHIEWRIPHWQTFREHNRFFTHWRWHAAKCSTLDNYASAWLMAQLEVLLDEPFEPVEWAQAPPNIKRFKELLIKIATEKPKRLMRKKLQQSAIAAMIYLLAPESGGSADFVHALITETEDALNDMENKEEIISKVRAYRTAAFDRVRKELWQSEYPAGETKIIKLLFDISEECALETAKENVKRENEQMGQLGFMMELNEYVHNILVNIDTFIINPLPNEKELRDCRDCLISLPSKAGAQYHIFNINKLKNALELLLAILEIKNKHKPHKISELYKGELVPKISEIEKIEGLHRPKPKNIDTTTIDDLPAMPTNIITAA